ncbi:MAG: Hsp20/alpha crystallin family protein [Methanophagales archaeon]|nr:Hsp20/alpha crystallin family protein [Methanophagales archaeon]
MMEELELEEGRTVKWLSDFIPSDLRMKIFGVVKEHYKNIKDEELDKHFPRIFAFALTNFPDVREVVRKDFLEEIETLCKDLGISGEGTRRPKNNLEKFMEHIDGKSREIIWYLLRNRYAGIRDLSDLVGASADNDVLTRIREVINPTARKYLRKEIMEFKESEIDESSGKKVVFKWWLRDDLQLTEKREELLDVFDDGDEMRVIAELPPTVAEKDIKVEVNDDTLGIIVNASKGKYERKVPLFYAVEKAMEKTYKNRILAIRLNKKRIRRTNADGAEKN